MVFLDKLPILAYIDGACQGNPGPGGFGVYLEHNNQTKEICGAEDQTTNNRMEMMAAICALEVVPVECPIVLITDSKYLRDGITSWILKWKQNCWKTANRTPVKNQDLWKRLDSLIECRKVTWQWVKGHSGNFGNERADFLAKNAIKNGRG